MESENPEAHLEPLVMKDKGIRSEIYSLLKCLEEKCGKRRRNLFQKQPVQFEEFDRIWEKKKSDLESGYKLEQSLMHSIYGKGTQKTNNQLELLAGTFKKKMEEHNLLEDVEREKLKAEQFVARDQERQKLAQWLAGCDLLVAWDKERQLCLHSEIVVHESTDPQNDSEQTKASCSPHHCVSLLPQMDLVNTSNDGTTNMGQRAIEGNAAQADDYKKTVDGLFTEVDRLEQRLNEVEQFYLNTNLKESKTSRSSLMGKDKEKEKHVPSMKKLQQDALCREAAAAKRMQDLIRQFGCIFRQITQHKYAWPFMQPVDVEGLGLDDYYQIIDRPMDFSSIKNQMEAKDGAGYKHVREVYSDMRLVFKNAMKYNEHKSEVHVMAKSLLEYLEEKWLKFLPKVIEEEEKREQEEAEAQSNMQLAQEAFHAKLARDLSNKLYDIDTKIEQLRERVVRKCRQITTLEKRKLGVALSNLSPEDLSKALEIVAQDNLTFNVNVEEVELDINAQSESTLWRLKFFVKDILKGRCKNLGNNNINSPDAANNHENNIISKHKQEICDALAKTAKKRKK